MGELLPERGSIYHMRPALQAVFLLITCTLFGSSFGIAPAQNVTTIVGKTVDKKTGLPLSAVHVSVEGAHVDAMTDANGNFTLSGIAPGEYVLRARISGYQTTETELIDASHQVSGLVLALEATTDGADSTIGHTSTRTSESLQTANVISNTITSDQAEQQGYTTLGPLLLNLPGVSTAGSGLYGGETLLNVRGFGQLETVTLIDGHRLPTYFGAYDMSNSPIFGLKSVQVVYGSGSGTLYNVDAIGGVVDMQTLDPTTKPTFAIDQSYGTYANLTTSVKATGQLDLGSHKLGYAFAYGVDGTAGQFRGGSVYGPFYGVDASAPPGSAAYALNSLDLSSAQTTRGALAKLDYSFSDATTLSADVFTSNQVKNTSGTYSRQWPYAYLYATGLQDLKGKSPTDPCPAGQFTATNLLGQPNGFDGAGNPDGGMTCQTPQQYANYRVGITGDNGFYYLRDTDYNLRFNTTAKNNSIVVDAFSNVGSNYTLGLNQQLFGGNNGGTSEYGNVLGSETGFTLIDDFSFHRNDLAIGYAYVNSSVTTEESYNGGSPAVLVSQERSYFLRDSYTFSKQLTLNAYDWFKHSTLTSSSYSDPRIAAVYSSGRNVIRAAIGATSTQPDPQTLGVEFSPISVANFTTDLVCGEPQQLGDAPSSLLKPERGVDEELSVGHSWFGDSITQISIYSENVQQKLLGGYLGLGQLPNGIVPANYLDQYVNAYQTHCGAAPDVANQFQLYGTFNAGTVLGQGVEVSGTQRLGHAVKFDYTYDLQSTKLVSAPNAILTFNPTLVPGSQLPDVPMHTFTGLFTIGLPHDTVVGVGAQYFAGPMTNLNIGPYTMTNAFVTKQINKNLRLNVAVQNLLNYAPYSEFIWAAGQTVGLNQFATPADYLPYLGASTQNAFGAGGRRIVVNLSGRI